MACLRYHSNSSNFEPRCLVLKSSRDSSGASLAFVDHFLRNFEVIIYAHLLALNKFLGKQIILDVKSFYINK